MSALEPNKALPINARVFLWLLVVGVLWLWVGYFRFRPGKLDDYATVTGKLLSAEESISFHNFQKSGHLEIRLEESALRFCVPEDGYIDYFRREAFFKEVAKGSTVQLSALASEVASPRKPLLNPEPTIFVRGVRAGGRDYCTIQDHIAWQKRDHWWRLGLAAVGTAFLSFIFHRLSRRSEPPNSTQHLAA
jgi:hypothetical protein